jgi:DNA-binding CsgD family transcriptional regulator
VRVGLPLGTLVRASTFLGDYDRAAEILDGPVPPEMLETAFGMLYLQARGQFLLATGSLQRARVEFESCLDFMRQRGVELPNLLPWRTHLAEVHARLGALEQARSFAEEHLSLTATRGGHWARGIALRLLARTADKDEARTLLNTSINELHASGAQLELASTLTELSRSYRDAGEVAKAAQTERCAQQIAAACGTTSGPVGAAPATPVNRARRVPAASVTSVRRLSTAEQRVATLAANGRTNAEIARHLFVTVSTVEQHLTHIYRKLEIRGRSELVSVADLALAIQTAG